jgi:hypothetical protein
MLCAELLNYKQLLFYLLNYSKSLFSNRGKFYLEQESRVSFCCVFRYDCIRTKKYLNHLFHVRERPVVWIHNSNGRHLRVRCLLCLHQTKLYFQRTVTECGLNVVVTANVLALDENVWDTLLSGYIQQSILDVSAVIHFIEFKDLVINLEVIKEARGLSAEWAVALGKDDNLKMAEQRCVSIIVGDKWLDGISILLLHHSRKSVP